MPKNDLFKKKRYNTFVSTTEMDRISCCRNTSCPTTLWQNTANTCICPQCGHQALFTSLSVISEPAQNDEDEPGDTYH